MFGWISQLFGSKKLESVIYATRRVKVSGVWFTIRKINTLHYLEGSKIIQQTYALYRSGKKENLEDVSQKKVVEFFSQFLVACVESPKLSLTKDGPGLFVEDLFVDWEMILGIYEEVMLFTYGKKKTKFNTSLNPN